MRTEKELLLELHAKNASLQQNKSFLDNPLFTEIDKKHFAETIEELTLEIAAIERLLQSRPA